jgi:NAD(P)-dependent dehydrogenase (short-subunit alcohol dehydrogenase family)
VNSFFLSDGLLFWLQFPGVLAYNMSKAAVDQFTRTVALELADKGVRVNAVNPGVIVTDIHKRGGMSEQDYEQVSCGNGYVL